MTAVARRGDLSPARRRRLYALGLLRSLATAAVLVVLYYLLPLNHLTNVPAALAVGLVILVAVVVMQVWQVIRARYPEVRAVEALSTTLPLFLLLFASAYFMMARGSPANFNVHSLTRTDALYFTVTVFSTVGFGDITAVSQPARLVVIVQIVLDLLALGLGIRVFVGAVQLARRQARAADPGVSSQQTTGESGDTR